VYNVFVYALLCRRFKQLDINFKILQRVQMMVLELVAYLAGGGRGALGDAPFYPYCLNNPKFGQSILSTIVKLLLPDVRF